jgi:hypothetical protein
MAKAIAQAESTSRSDKTRTRAHTVCTLTILHFLRISASSRQAMRMFQYHGPMAHRAKFLGW